eukprot:6319683-Amphidinium_carterae.1
MCVPGFSVSRSSKLSCCFHNAPHIVYRPQKFPRKCNKKRILSHCLLGMLRSVFAKFWILAVGIVCYIGISGHDSSDEAAPAWPEP